MTADLTDPAFKNEDAAREYFESQRWPDGPVCPHCGNDNRRLGKWDDAVKTHIAKMRGKSHRAGLYWCFKCEDSFSVTVGTVMERSHIALHKWALAFHLMASSKKGISAHQLHRMLGITYKSAWFMCHRIREAMHDTDPTPMGGKGKTVEADETFIGPQPFEFRNETGWKRKRSGSDMSKVLTLVERGGRAKSLHVESLKIADIRKALNAASRDSALMTDAAKHYNRVGREFASHESVNHQRGEYVRGDATTNTVEGFFSIFKRGMKGVYQHCGEQHLQRYLNEFDFRYSNRVALGVDDKERAKRAVKGASGKRLTYHATKGK